MRHLDEEKLTDEIPYHSFNRVEKLNTGEVVPVEIEMYSVVVVLHAGEPASCCECEQGEEWRMQCPHYFIFLPSSHTALML